MILPNPLAIAPFKRLPDAPPELKDWLSRHGWPIEIRRMTAGDAQYWDREVLPTIKRIEFERLVGIRPDAQPRADAYWPATWSMIRRAYGTLSHLPSMMRPLKPEPTAPQTWTVLAPGNHGHVPIGMLMGLTGQYLPEGAPTGPHVFAWLLTTAPDEHLEANGIPGALALGRVLLDVVIQISLATSSEGRVMLHADPRGGPGLLIFYSRSMMLLLDPAQVPRVVLNRKNDGRYFLFDEGRAGAFAMSLDAYRTSSLPGTRRTPEPVRVR